MKIPCCHPRVFALFLALLVLGGRVADVRAEETVVLEFDAPWRYFATGDRPSDQGPIAWQTPLYDDANWRFGLGVFGFPTNEDLLEIAGVATALELYPNGDTNNPAILTYYFRTTFTLSDTDSLVGLTLTALVDDGAVFYLNGSEVGRIAMLPGPVGNTNLSPRQMEIRNLGPDFVAIPGSYCKPGTNVFAVEVHQNRGGSSDVFFGLKAVATRGLPLRLTRQPADQSVEKNAPLILTSTAEGNATGYQWRKNGADLRGANGAELRIPAVSVVDAGSYSVVVTNSLERVTSTNALITVIDDRTGPTLLRAEFGPTSDACQLIFNETLLRSSTLEATNYRLEILVRDRLQPAPITLTAIQQQLGLVRLRFSAPLDRSALYWITVNNVQDSAGNVIASNTRTGLTIPGTAAPIAFGDTWWYYGGYLVPPPSSDWLSPKSDNQLREAGWKLGTGLFHSDTNLHAQCSSSGEHTVLPLETRNLFFRKSFLLPAGTLSVGQVSLSAVVADGAVISLNGQELARIAVSNGPISVTTFALQDAPTAICADLKGIGVSNLLSGTNILAAEVFQGPSGGYPVFFFDAQLTVNYLRFAVPTNTVPEGLFVEPVSGQLRFTWDSADFRLESALTPTGPWQRVPDKAGPPPVILSPMGTNQFFRLVRP